LRGTDGSNPSPSSEESAANFARLTLSKLDQFGGTSDLEDTASAAQVDVLYRQIGQLKVENDFLPRKLGK
jgi:hypothetical protein